MVLKSSCGKGCTKAVVLQIIIALAFYGLVFMAFQTDGTKTMKRVRAIASSVFLNAPSQTGQTVNENRPSYSTDDLVGDQSPKKDGAMPVSADTAFSVVPENQRPDNVNTRDDFFDGGNLRQLWKHMRKETLQLYLLSAIGVNGTYKAKSYSREIKVTGWDGEKRKNVQIKCCFWWSNEKISEFKNPVKEYPIVLPPAYLMSSQYYCPTNGSFEQILGVTISMMQSPCPSVRAMYIKPEIAQKPPVENSFAICAKILYGPVDGRDFVYWLEYHMQMGVRKVLLYTYNISSDAEEVIQRYISLGIIERKSFDLPLNNGDKRRNPDERNKIVFHDRHVTAFDCIQRLSAYKYFSIMDIDEFIVPFHHKDLFSLMDNLTATYPTAAGFTLLSYMFIKEWGITGDKNGSLPERYIVRTPALYERVKNILFPERIIESSIFSHDFYPKPGYIRVNVTEDIAALYHYRHCYPNLGKICRNKKQRFTDARILPFIDSYKNRTLWGDKFIKTNARS